MGTMARVDATTSATADEISVNMRGLLQTEIIAPINAIIDGIQCNFLAEYYQETVWGLCYQGLVGLNTIGKVYVGLGFLQTSRLSRAIGWQQWLLSGCHL